MSGDEALPIGRYVVGAPKQAPFGATGEVDSFSGSTNSQQNRILSGRMPKPSYNVAQPSIRATQENNGGGVPQILPTATVGTGQMGPHPWQIQLRQLDGGDFEIKIEQESSLYEELGSFVTVGISGVDEWVDLSEGYIVLESIYADGKIEETNVLFGQSSFDDAVTFNNGEQEKFRYIIGNIKLENGVPIIKQYCFGHLTLIEICVNGNPAQYPISI